MSGVIPDVSTTITDGALGLVGTNGNQTPAIIGTSSAGTPNVPVSVGDVQTLVSTFGSGELVEAAAHVLAAAGGPVVCMKTAASTAGVAGSVTKVGSGSSVMTVTGTPVDDYDVIVTTIQGGTNPAAGTATFKYSVDGGRTTSAEIALPTAGTYTLGATGVGLAFSAAALTAGTTYSFHASGPAFTNGDLATSMDALLASPLTWFMVYAAGIPADTSGTAAFFATLTTKLVAAETTGARFARAILQSADDTDTNLTTMRAGLSGTKVALAAGFANITSQISGAQQKRGAAHSAIARLASIVPSEDIGRFQTGPVFAVQAIGRDEFKTPALDAQNFLTLRTHVGQSGFYFTRGKNMAPLASDFQLIQNARVVDIAATAGRAALLRYLNDSIRIDKTTGFILEKEALTIEAYVEQRQRDALTQPGDADNVAVTVSRTENILSTGKLPVRIRVVPHGYANFITQDVGLTNPALNPS